MSGGSESRELEAQLQDSVGVGDGQRVIAGAKYVIPPPPGDPQVRNVVLEMTCGGWLGSCCGGLAYSC